MNANIIATNKSIGLVKTWEKLMFQVQSGSIMFQAALSTAPKIMKSKNNVRNKKTPLSFFIDPINPPIAPKNNPIKTNAVVENKEEVGETELIIGIMRFVTDIDKGIPAMFFT